MVLKLTTSTIEQFDNLHDMYFNKELTYTQALYELDNIDIDFEHI